MTFKVIATEDDDRSYARCTVQGDRTALLRIGRNKIEVEMQETSIAGYTLEVDAKHKRLLKNAKSIHVSFNGMKADATLETIMKAPNGKLRIGLKRQTEPKKAKSGKNSFLSRFARKADAQNTTNVMVAYGGFVIVLFTVMALPGLGDRLGTAPRIEGAVQWVVTAIDQQVRTWI